MKDEEKVQSEEKESEQCKNAELHNYEGAKLFLDFCNQEYFSEKERASRLENKATILFPILLAILGFLPLYFNLTKLFSYPINSGLDVLKISLLIGLLSAGCILVLLSILKIYSIVKPHNYLTVDIKTMYEKKIQNEGKEVTTNVLVAEIIESITYNRFLLNKEFSKYRCIWVLTLTAALCIILACFLSNVILS